MNVQVVGQIIQYNNKRMKRARRLYVRLVKSVIEQDQFALRRAAKLACKRRLWLTPVEKDIEFYILRLMCKLDGYNDWHKWLEDKKWSNGGWHCNWIKRAA